LRNNPEKGPMQITLSLDSLLLSGSVLGLAAIFVSAVIARRFSIPGALLFLGLGMIVGDDGLGLISLSDATFVRDAGVIALLFILLEGGLTTKPTDLKRAALPGLLLATVGVLVTAAITAAGVWWLLDVDWLTAALIGAVVGSTDAAAVFSMMRHSALPRRTAALLRVESGSNDPLAAVITIGLVTTVTAGAGVTDWVSFAAIQMFGGIAAGVAVGALAAFALRRLTLGVEGFYPLAVIGFAGFAYAVAAQFGASGFVAVYIVGLMVGAYVPRRRRVILDFHEASANAAEIGLFLLLGLLVLPSRLPAVAFSAILVALILTLVARPAAVWLCTLGQGYGWPERTVISLGGLKGAVPIVLATFPLTAQVADAQLIFDIVFFVTLVSLLLQGSALMPVVRALGLANTEPAWSPVAEAVPLYGIEIDLIELHVTRDMPIVGKPLAELGIPDGSLITAIVRNNQVIIPSGDTVPAVADVLLITTRRTDDALARCTAWARQEI
jgi:potassium/hydrogen antiporter